jgi:hypothetical protein
MAISRYLLRSRSLNSRHWLFELIELCNNTTGGPQPSIRNPTPPAGIRYGKTLLH